MTTECTVDTSIDSLVAVLRESQQRLARAVAPLDQAGVRQQSYDDDWSIAQVLSHLGSQTEVHGLIVDTMTAGGVAPGMEQMQPIWDRWNAKDPMDQVRDSIEADRRYLDRLSSIPVDVRESARLEVFGKERSLTDVVAMRLAEHAVHTWEVVVMLEPDATLQRSALETLLSLTVEYAAYTGKASVPHRVLVQTIEPVRQFVLEFGPDGGRISEVDDLPVDGTLALPAEAFIRLFYGRLDTDHRPPLNTEGVDVDVIIAAFPGL